MHLLFQLSTRSWLTAGLSVLCSGSDLPRALCWCLILPVLVVNWVSCAPKLGISLSIPAGSKEGSLVLPVNGCRALRAGLKPLSQWEWSRGWGCPVPRGLGISLEDRRLLSKPTHPGKAQLFALRQAKGFLCGTETISGLIFVSPASQQSAIDLGR